MAASGLTRGRMSQASHCSTTRTTPGHSRSGLLRVGSFAGVIAMADLYAPCGRSAQEFPDPRRRHALLTMKRCLARVRLMGWSLTRTSVKPRIKPNRSTAVSYTHLRAHETPEHLVCR